MPDGVSVIDQPCKFCGEPAAMTGTKQCDGCYEVASRLGDFLRHKNGRDLVRQALAGLEDRKAKAKRRSAWCLQCTAPSASGSICGRHSPETRTSRGMKPVARLHGWRVWGDGEPLLLDGEALCPEHVDGLPRKPRQ